VTSSNRHRWIAVSAAACLCAAATAAAETHLEGIGVYTNPDYQWSIAYPAGWGLEAKDSGFIRISSPAKDGLCGIHSSRVKFTTADELTGYALDYAQKRLKESKGLDQVTLKREKTTLRNGIEANDVLVEIRPGGQQSRRIYAVSQGNGFLIDCASSAANWANLGPDFERILKSFTVGK
jgi:hypothetical protein